jgi:hypothetical protein
MFCRRSYVRKYQDPQTDITGAMGKHELQLQPGLLNLIMEVSDFDICFSGKNFVETDEMWSRV